MSPAVSPLVQRREDLDDGSNHRAYAVSVPTPLAAGRFYLGWSDIQGHTLVAIEGVTNAAIAASGSAYVSFQPFVSRQKPDGTVKVTTLGTAVNTTSQGFVANAKRRLHTQKRLSYAVPEGAAFGVDVAVTGSPSLGQFTFLVLTKFVG